MRAQRKASGGPRKGLRGPGAGRKGPCGHRDGFFIHVRVFRRGTRIVQDLWRCQECRKTYLLKEEK